MHGPASPHRYRLPDGRQLISPRPVTADRIIVGMWIAFAGQPRQIEDLRQRGGGGRLVRLAGSPAVILSLGQTDALPVFTVIPAIPPPDGDPASG
jgi:hypothetical protein